MKLLVHIYSIVHLWPPIQTTLTHLQLNTTLLPCWFDLKAGSWSQAHRTHCRSINNYTVVFNNPSSTVRPVSSVCVWCVCVCVCVCVSTSANLSLSKKLQQRKHKVAVQVASNLGGEVVLSHFITVAWTA